MHRILLIDDDEHLAPPLAAYLRRFDFELVAAHRPSEGFARLAEGGIDAVILDVMLPEMDGFAVCRQIRRDSDIPVLMLTARGDVTDRVVGLELGADDYLPKPFEPRELVARIRAVLRRGQAVARAAGAVSHFAGWHFDRLQRSLRAPNGTVMPLSAAEFRLLGAFIEHAGQVLSRERLLLLTQGVGVGSGGSGGGVGARGVGSGGGSGGSSGGGAAASERSIDLAVSRLRGKLGEVGGVPLIRTMRGAGYLFDPPPVPGA
jgi:two-component system OmpR family response regulator